MKNRKLASSPKISPPKCENKKNNQSQNSFIVTKSTTWLQDTTALT